MSIAYIARAARFGTIGPCRDVEMHPCFRVGDKAVQERRCRDCACILQHDRYRNFVLYTRDGKFAEDLAEAEKALGGLEVKKRQVDAQHRSDRRPADEVLTPEQKLIVQKTCDDEFKLRGYEK